MILKHNVECTPRGAFTIITLSLFRHTRDIKKTHHLVVAKNGYVSKVVSGIVNLAQIHEHKIQMFAGNPPTPLYYKIRQVHCGLSAMGHEVSPLLLGDCG